MSYAVVRSLGAAPSIAACPNGYVVVPGVSARCDDLCDTYDAAGKAVDVASVTCAASCPDGYVAAVRRRPEYPGGEMRVCVTPAVFADIKNQRPNEIEAESSGAAIFALVALGGLGLYAYWSSR